jgi:hypothetical protein
LFFHCVESSLSKACEKTKTVMSEANERLFLFWVPPGSLEEPATTAIPGAAEQPFLSDVPPRATILFQ